MVWIFEKNEICDFASSCQSCITRNGKSIRLCLKMSSLVSIIGIGDLTRKANELVTTTYRPLEIYTFLILEYLILILVVSYFVRKLEKKLNINKFKLQ